MDGIPELKQEMERMMNQIEIEALYLGYLDTEDWIGVSDHKEAHAALYSAICSLESLEE